jgi:hypothetical protein
MILDTFRGFHLTQSIWIPMHQSMSYLNIVQVYMCAQHLINECTNYDDGFRTMCLASWRSGHG